MTAWNGEHIEMRVEGEHEGDAIIERGVNALT